MRARARVRVRVRLYDGGFGGRWGRKWWEATCASRIATVTMPIVHPRPVQVAQADMPPGTPGPQDIDPAARAPGREARGGRSEVSANAADEPQ